MKLLFIRILKFIVVCIFMIILAGVYKFNFRNSDLYVVDKNGKVTSFEKSKSQD